MLLIIFLKSGISQVTIPLDIPRVVPNSPTATEMGKYFTYPVDYSTGIPNINIPLHDIVLSELNIPISISYHGSGLKPKDGSNYIGTGWTLNLEPSVSRTILGIPDESNGYPFPYQHGWFHNPYRDNSANTDGLKTALYTDFVSNVRDISPDRFSYKLANSSGSGYFHQSANILTFLALPKNNDKVVYNYASGLTIHDENGIKYEFNGESEKNGDISTRWMCKSIWSAKNPNVKLVDFKYISTLYSFPRNTYSNMKNKAVLNFMTSGNLKKNMFVLQNSNINTYYSISPNYSSYPGNLLDVYLDNSPSLANDVFFPTSDIQIDNLEHTVRLDEVNYLGNKIVVNYRSVGNSPNNVMVYDELELFNKDNILVKKVKFYITLCKSSAKSGQLKL